MSSYRLSAILTIVTPVLTSAWWPKRLPPRTLRTWLSNNYSENWLAASIGGVGLLIVAMALVPLRAFLGRQNIAILLLLCVQLVAATGGRIGGIVGAAVAALSFDFFFTEPYLELVILDRIDIITTILLFAVGPATSELAHLMARRISRRQGRQ